MSHASRKLLFGLMLAALGAMLSFALSLHPGYAYAASAQSANSASTQSTQSANSASTQSTQSSAVPGSHSSREALVSERSTLIPQNESVEDVLVLGHNVTVAGRVSEILIVLDGNVHLKSHSDTRLVVDVGGTVTQERGAHVNAMYHFSLNTPFWNGALFGVTFALLAWAVMLAVSVGLVILAVLVAVAMRNQRIPLGNQDSSMRRMGVLGVLVSIVSLAVISILGLTLVGIPIATVIALLYLALGIIGFAMTSLWMGGVVLRMRERDRPNHVQTLVGAILLTAFMNIPFVGLLLFILMWFVGVGAATTWFSDFWRRTRRRRVAAKTQ